GPEWTDHNVHDPGVTLIELFAWMTEQVIFRLNRVPDNLYVRFLDLLGVRLLPPTAARAPITFWLTAPQPSTVRIPVATQVATLRTETTDAIVFETVQDLDLITCALQTVGSTRAGERVRWFDEDSMRGDGVPCFGSPPHPEDALLVGLDEAVPSCAVTLRLGCAIHGLGIDPTRPPLAWDAYDG